MVSLDPTDQQNENVDTDRLKKLLVLEVVGILGDSELDQKIYNFQIIQEKIFSLMIMKKLKLSRAGFNISIHEGTHILQSRIHCPDFIDASATETSTIYQVCLTIRFSKNYAKLFCSSASMKRWYCS